MNPALLAQLIVLLSLGLLHALHRYDLYLRRKEYEAELKASWERFQAEMGPVMKREDDFWRRIMPPLP